MEMKKEKRKQKWMQNKLNYDVAIENLKCSSIKLDNCGLKENFLWFVRHFDCCSKTYPEWSSGRRLVDPIYWDSHITSLSKYETV